MFYKKLFNFALLTGEIMLRNGAETYRVEDTINRILKTSNFEVVESFVTPTGIFATIDDPSIEMITSVKRVDKRTIHLRRIALANDISRQYCSGKISLNKAYNDLLKAKDEAPYGFILTTIGISLVAGLFTIMFGGSYKDMIVSIVIGIFLSFLQSYLSKFETTSFFYDMMGGGLIGLIALILTKYIPIGDDINMIIIGSIMPLVPGVAITNGVRDTIEGNFVAGISRMLEAFIIAASIAIGVGVVLKLYYILYGGILS
jgi:uncharacterized membrane protein YjjP (DUF1212 family)